FGGAIYAADAAITATSCVISNNTGVQGGGIFLENTVLDTDNSAFTDNTASESGGAIYAQASNVTVGEVVLFENNEASIGGALFVTGSSILTVAGDDVSFARNKAATFGGGLYALQSTAGLTGKAELFGNTAEFGGAIFSDNGSFSVTGDMLLSKNFANDSGGALYGGLSDIDIIAGTVVLENNSAVNGGGGLVMLETVLHVHTLGEAEFVGNKAGFGGAAYTSASTLLVDGGVRFAENTVDLSGGALYSDLSTINISGNALWENNVSPVAGGGMLIWTSNMYVQRSGTVAFVGNTAVFGGAAAIDHSTLSTYGNVSFSANLANGTYGGALYLSFSIVDIIAGSAVWEDNTAAIWGGALMALQSGISVQSLGKAEFHNNVAVTFGGAAYMSNSTLTCTGDVIFEKNVASENGGALYS
ncbi:unnamed protein product, partial [Laminaria digitata]